MLTWWWLSLLSTTLHRKRWVTVCAALQEKLRYIGLYLIAVTWPAVQTSYASPSRRYYEQVVRRLLRMPTNPAVLLLHYYPWWRSPGDGVAEGLYYREPETEMTVLGQVGRLLKRPARLHASGNAWGYVSCSSGSLHPLHCAARFLIA